MVAGQLVLVDRSHDNTIAELVLNRPSHRNALTPALVTELTAALRQVTEDPKVRVILLRGAGGFLCSGLDLQEMRRARHEEGSDGGFQKQWRAFHSAMYHCPKPTLCVLEGAAIAGGSGLALSADFLVAADDAKFHVAEVNFGMAAPMNMLWLLVKHGRATAVEFAVGGHPYTGADIRRRGLAVASAPSGPEALTLGRRWAERLAANDPVAMTVSKEMTRVFPGCARVGGLDGGEAIDFDAAMSRFFELAARAGSRPPSSLRSAKSKAAAKL